MTLFPYTTLFRSIDCHFIRERINAGDIRVTHVSTKEQLADIFTKALTSERMHYMLSKMSIQNLYAHLEGRYQDMVQNNDQQMNDQQMKKIGARAPAETSNELEESGATLLSHILCNEFLINSC